MHTLILEAALQCSIGKREISRELNQHSTPQLCGSLFTLPFPLWRPSSLTLDPSILLINFFTKVQQHSLILIILHQSCHRLEPCFELQ